jgi:hypothetical protein
MLSLCKAKHNFTDDILSGMWLPFVQIKGNYYKNLLLYVIFGRLDTGMMC